MRLVGEGAWGEPPNREDARNVLRRAVELGINLIDTADAYGPMIAEELIAEALHPYPPGLVIATKGGLTRQGPSKSKPCGRPDYLQQQLEMSLRRLRLDRIDLYQLHRIDPTVPLADTLGALKDAQQAGKIRHIGLSEVTPEQIEEAEKIVPIVSVQNRFNLFDRKSEHTLRFCEQRNIAFLPWYPMGGSATTSIVKKTTSNDPHANHPVAEFAEEHNATRHSDRDSVAAARQPRHLPHPRHQQHPAPGRKRRGSLITHRRRRMGRARSHRRHPAKLAHAAQTPVSPHTRVCSRHASTPQALTSPCYPYLRPYSGVHSHHD